MVLEEQSELQFSFTFRRQTTLEEISSTRRKITERVHANELLALLDDEVFRITDHFASLFEFGFKLVVLLPM